MIGLALRRVVGIAIAFIVSLLAGAATLFFMGSRWAAEQVSSYAPDDPNEIARFMNEAMGVLAFVFTVAPVLTLVPAIAIVIVGELARIRSLLYYVVAGGAAAALMPYIAAPQDAAQNSTYATPYFTLMATAGFVAGFVYWLLAGRRA